MYLNIVKARLLDVTVHQPTSPNKRLAHNTLVFRLRKKSKVCLPKVCELNWLLIYFPHCSHLNIFALVDNK